MQNATALTAKQTKFVAEYLVDGNGTRAAVAAGYGVAGARVAACRTLANDNVKATIAAAQAQDAQRLQIERRDVIQQLLAAYETARDQRLPAVMVSAARELGRLLGFYSAEVRRVEISDGGNDTMRRMEALSDAELIATINAGAERIAT